jgi:hypothetical protein
VSVTSPRRLTVAIAVLALAVAAAACSDDGGSAAADATSSTAPPAREASTDTAGAGRLYVQRAESGASDVDDTGTGTLSLTGVDADTVWFQDRPGRDAGRMATGDFVDGWDAVGFGDDPPNAALEIDTPSGTSATHVLVLSNPRWDEAEDTLTYDVEVAADGTEVLPAEFDASSLFIDDGGAASSQPLVLQVDDAQPGQQISVELGAEGASTVAFSSSPGTGGGSSGLVVASDSGVLPLTQLSLSGDRLVVRTSSAAGGGAATSFRVEGFLVAGTDTDTFTLTSTSDPGVEITAALGGAQPQVVNTSPTTFEWSR